MACATVANFGGSGPPLRTPPGGGGYPPPFLVKIGFPGGGYPPPPGGGSFLFLPYALMLFGMAIWGGYSEAVSLTACWDGNTSGLKLANTARAMNMLKSQIERRVLV